MASFMLKQAMMSTLTKMTRTMKKLELPRPLKPTSANSSVIHSRNSMMDLKINSVDDLIVLTETVAYELTHGNYDRYLQANVALMYENLKLHGAQLESIYKDLLDRFFVVFRNGSQDDNLDKKSRLHLLELIELRAKQWQTTDHMSHYYKHRVTHAEPSLLAAADPIINDTIQLPLPIPTPLEPPVPLLLGPGEIIKTSGKFTKPTKIPGKNYSKDEVVIRNADSGKVMGIKGRRVHMIEELSDTIISFQRVSPGAKERLVQITGPNEENVNHAKHLIGDTIRRNASPVRLEGATTNLGDSTSSLNSSASDESGRPSALPHIPLSIANRPLLHSYSTNDANLGEYRYTVTVGTHSIKITGDNLNIVNMAKLVLDEYFENFNASDTPVATFGDVFNYEPRHSIESVGNNNQDNYNSNGSEDTIKANGLSSPTDDDVFIKNSSVDSNTETVRRSRFSGSYSEKIEAERSLCKLSYTHEMLLHYATSPLSKQAPNLAIPTEIARKTSLDFNGEVYLQKTKDGRLSLGSTSEEIKDSPEPE